ncbi:DUF1707 domain-containing protein [Plantactinospora sp. KBS50]|uniref:DUF1707 SHOCT-like domain-containing protein n=1 Tax=Plantactinospora sp. KBS50 TaxID=2024580 RepID=UPI0018DF9F6F|nr:DUF1707 domain-containing protein [Plantactinospora sp. KBS50]
MSTESDPQHRASQPSEPAPGSTPAAESRRPAAPESGPRLRASDAERERLADLLRTAMAEGRLTLAEGEERLATAYALVYRDELRPLVADLPGGHRVVPETNPGPAEPGGDTVPPGRYGPGRYGPGRYGPGWSAADGPWRRWPGPRRVPVIAVLVALVVVASVAAGHPVFWPLPVVFIVFGLSRRILWGRWAAGRRSGPPSAG